MAVAHTSNFKARLKARFQFGGTSRSPVHNILVENRENQLNFESNLNHVARWPVVFSILFFLLRSMALIAFIFYIESLVFKLSVAPNLNCSQDILVKIMLREHRKQRGINDESETKTQKYTKKRVPTCELI